MKEKTKGNRRKQKSRFSQIDKKQFTLPLLMCLIGLGFNIGGTTAVRTFDLPFYFDCAGTILIAYMGGYVPGIVVGLTTNILKCVEDPASIYYAPISICIALVTAYLYRKGKLKTIRHFILYTCLITVIAIVVGGGLSWMVEENAGEIFAGGMVRYCLLELGDKAISVAFVCVMLSLIPEKVRKRFELTLWMQDSSIEQKELERVGQKNRYRHPLGRKIVVSLGVISISIAFICAIACVELYRQFMIDQQSKIGKAVASIAASFVEADDVEKYLDEGDSFQSYKETKEELTKLLKNSNQVSYIYVYKIMSDGCHVVFDIDTESVDAANLGDVISFDEAFMEYLPDLLEGKEIDAVISEDKYGALLSYYVPVYASDGECVCYAAADISMDNLKDYRRLFFVRLIAIFISFWILVLAIGLWLAKYHLILPINAMAKVTDEFEYTDEYARRRNLHNIKQLQIKTGDEIERMYWALTATIEESTCYFEESKHQNEKISKMQEGLLMVLADVVENRDESTGSHVRKTAAYVEITINKMRSLGYYKEELTEELAHNTIRSAPLHDIGKIAIPDAILNKPDRLTDEEFGIMKSHAAEGRTIIERAIETMPDVGYLVEARNLAGYHHEKWNGTGYPEGLAGEEIPLSARIMAVADVFDALVSRRAYKEPFSYEKAFSIIKEDAGTHFDPYVADAFLKAADDVVIVADRFAE
ncbi:HD-GYP domain-containing protein [Eubacterium oxidoreducens]|uniref:HD domain-containing protein n=1 Tax=Eubacterium oxidoreducens TaxID=1732 RepID=A0A1G6AUR0_EUBOX|nr:HD-GYP domain-containing protein [Eubacterium oxidoreducens]SDB11983.1 HD domain-containing protein [Eubacterium oxidoreducens]